MSEQVWYVYHQQQQLGPFEAKQVVQLLDNNMISNDAYAFKVGWKDWRPIEDVADQLGMQKKIPPPGTTEVVKRRLGAPRASIAGRVIIHNNGQLVIGSGINISATGIFIETTEQIFKLGEILKVTVKAEGFAKQFNAAAEVIRINADPKFPVGYGLKFSGLDREIANEIQRLVDQKNKEKNSQQQKQLQKAN